MISEVKTFALEGREMPALLLGSSPFCGSRQFGEKAAVYYRRFFENPANITELLVHICRKGYRGAHLIPFAPVAGAALEAYRVLGYSFPIIFTLMAGEEEEQWKWINSVDTVGVFLHAFEADLRDVEMLKRFSHRCRESNVVPGISTHRGGETVPWVDSREDLDIQAFLVPFNKTGAHVYPSLDSTLQAVENTKKTVIGMKVLACGNLPPRDAFPFAFPKVNAVAVGMTAKEEIDENCLVFDEYSHLLKSTCQVR